MVFCISKIKFIALLAAIIIFAQGCQNQLSGEATADLSPIKIGSILILTGEGAAWGNAERNGIDMAIEDINAKGGIGGRMLTVDHQDDKSDPKLALDAYHKFVDVDNTKIIIGTTWSRTGLPLAPLAEKDKTLMISPSLGVKEFNEQGNFTLNTWPHDYLLSESLAEMMFKEGHRKVAVIGAKEVWTEDQTKSFKARFELLGGNVSLLLEPDPSDRDLRSEALKVKAMRGLDAIVLTNGVLGIGPVTAKRLKEVGVDLPLFSLTLDNNIIKAAGEFYEGMVFPTFLTPTKDFEVKYKTKFGIEVDIGADSAYDAVMMVKDAIEKTGSTDRLALQSYLNRIREFQGESGLLISDGKGGFTKQPKVMKIVSGTAVQIV
ncbi:MAG: ABC transporter substrate-binding protein [Nanoarchaeota archaeon]